MKKVIFAFLFCITLFYSCDILRDFSYEVIAWTPGDGFHSDPEGIVISLLMSHESDKVRTEGAFSITEDNRQLKGDFQWSGSQLIFTPASPLEAGREYKISLGTGAQNNKGLSLEKKFEVIFSTRLPGNKLIVNGTFPSDGGLISEDRGEIRIYFSDAVYLGSCIDHITFMPSVSGSWRLTDDNKTAVFTPRDPWQKNIIYNLNISSDFPGTDGTIMGNEYFSAFSMGDDFEKPVLLGVSALLADGTSEEIVFQEIYTMDPLYFSLSPYNGWERSTKLELVFSKAIETGQLRNLVITEPLIQLVMETSEAYSDRVVYRISEYPEWGSSVLFRLNSGIMDLNGNMSSNNYLFRIAFNGNLSREPMLLGIRLPMAPGIVSVNDDDQEPIVYMFQNLFSDLPIKTGDGRYPFETGTFTWMELYFDTAAGAEIDIFSLMNLFRVESTNSAVSFSPRSMVRENFTWINPAENWENFQRVEVRGFLTNTINNGIVTFHIPSGLLDTRGNRSTRDFRISLLK